MAAIQALDIFNEAGREIAFHCQIFEQPADGFRVRALDMESGDVLRKDGKQSG